VRALLALLLATGLLSSCDEKAGSSQAQGSATPGLEPPVMFSVKDGDLPDELYRMDFEGLRHSPSKGDFAWTNFGERVAVRAWTSPSTGCRNVTTVITRDDSPASVTTVATGGCRDKRK
jgi:hypothetical protein